MTILFDEFLLLTPVLDPAPGNPSPTNDGDEKLLAAISTDFENLIATVLLRDVVTKPGETTRGKLTNCFFSEATQVDHKRN